MVESQWELLEKGWWRKLLKPGTACVVSNPFDDFCWSASVFVDEEKVAEHLFESPDEAKKWAEGTLFNILAVGTK